MSAEPNKSLMARVERAVATLLERDGRITYLSLLAELGVLTPRDVRAWRAGHLPCLEKVIHMNLTKLTRIQTAVRRIARVQRLDRQVQRAPHGQRYSKTGNPFVEEEYGATYRQKRSRPGQLDETAVSRRSADPGARRRKARSAANTRQLFAAEAAYGDSVFRLGIGDVGGSIEALRRSHAALPTYAPAILSLGSVAYQRRRLAEGRRLFSSLLELPDETPDLTEILDQAGDFLIQAGRYAEGLDLFRRAAERFPHVAVFHQGIGCCAGHLDLHDDAIAASRTALDLEPQNQKFVNDLGWSLYKAGRTDEARRVLERAVAMDPTDALAAENLRICRSSRETQGAFRSETP